MAQLLEYLERLIEEAIEIVTQKDMVTAWQHANGQFLSSIGITVYAI